MTLWNPWHGCTKISSGCLNCYVFRRDKEFGKDTTILSKTAKFDLPIQKKRDGEYRLMPDGDHIYTCFTSDFFHPMADQWRKDAWEYINKRKDLTFFIVTKRIHRFSINLPSDWGSGYENVYIACTCENQEMADTRLPVFFNLPIRHYTIIHEPMLEAINIEPYLIKYGNMIDAVICGGESGEDARVCDFGWILNTMTQCVKYEVPFHFKQTGANFCKGNRIYHISRKNQIIQAAKAGIDYRYGDA